jgi:cation:H+ antiporter
LEITTLHWNDIPSIYVAYIAILLGFVGLIWSADRFVAGAAAMAKNMGLAPILIGLTIVSLGTSAPEILVSINAALSNEGSIALGNAIGSNIANIGLVLACTALVAKIPIQRHILKDELPVLIIVTLAAGYCISDARLTRTEGWALLALLIPVMVYLIIRKTKDLSPKEKALEQEDIPEMPTAKAVFWFVVGLVILIISSKILVSGAKTTAEHFSVSPLIIGLTVLAVGTSLPELAASIASALKGHHDIALGNIIGSNIFNLLAVMSLPGIIQPLSTDPAIFHRDYATMGALTLILVLLAGVPFLLRRKETKPSIGRLAGVGLLIIYAYYFTLLF